MILLSLLPALLAAERALGRLDQALAEPARRRRLAADAARRAAAAVIRLDGHRLDAHDFQRALAAPEHARGEAARAALLVPLFAQLPAGLTTTLPPECGTVQPKVLPTAEEAPADVVAAVRASIAALEEIDFRDGEGLKEHEGDAAVATPPPLLTPWTRPWLDELHRRWSIAQGGRPVGLGEARAADAGPALEAVAEALDAAPGLLGAAAAIRALALRPDPGAPQRRGPDDDAESAALRAAVAAERPPTSWWSVVVWLAAPDLIREACRLHHAGPPLTAALARDVTGYRLALAGTEGAWTRWVLDGIPELVAHELERLRHLDLLQEQWEARLAATPRRSSSRLPDVLDWLHDRPAFTISRVAGELKGRCGLSLRGVHLLVEQLAKAGVVRDIADRGGERVWACDLSFLPPGR
ncbi:hypothetical protein J2848_006817 [Azospirillum lipoferum]|uniref:HTH DNA binding domain-containing protein n=1 Tax=Azospirillum lipoferum TaxID=193 RepID=A0A5A9FYB7_AZOLI|nr:MULTISPECIES: hypothetical protein [Azospirillum]KAA0587178.1 hypothetical protein FZ942_34375 [Azospirillum lipoferum]MCP1615104.1 hypothetical protein [Azospirillum lipoferum]MDW5533001.1 hypothetical protein [Azospirillum sp. NL1]